MRVVSRTFTFGFCLLSALLVASALTLSAAEHPKTLQAAGSDLTDSVNVTNKVVYIDFFASWCAPCKQSFPFMTELYKQHGKDGFEIIAVNVDKDSADAAAFVEQARPPFRIVYDPDGKLAKRFNLKAMPSSFIYGRDGVLREQHQGFDPRDTLALQDTISQLLKEKAKP